MDCALITKSMNRPLRLVISIALLPAALAQLPDPKTLAPGVGERIFSDRLKSVAGQGAADCGTVSSNGPDGAVADCGMKAFQQKKPFFLGYSTSYGKALDFAYGMAGDANGNVSIVTYEVRRFPAVAPNKHTQLADDNHTRVTGCVKPITLDKTDRGELTCILPVNREESDKVAHQRPMDTTVCAILDNPAAFNNRLVRVRGHFSGNFEYSTLSGDGCQEGLWFGYGGAGGPPTLVAHVGGGGRPGSEDPEGKLILPVPVILVRDSKLKRFEEQTVLMANADEDYQKEHPGQYVSHCVTATFIGRIDAVSSEIHEFRKNLKKEQRQGSADYLGFGQMGLYEAQLIVQAVVDDAVLGVCGE